MDVIALPSTNEPFGITVVEAMAMGKAVVAGRFPEARARSSQAASTECWSHRTRGQSPERSSTV